MKKSTSAIIFALIFIKTLSAQQVQSLKTADSLYKDLKTPSQVDFNAGVKYAQNYKATGSFITGFFLPPLVSIGVYNSLQPSTKSLPVALLSFGTTLGILMAFDKAEKTPAPKFNDNPDFIKGYRFRVRKKKINNELLGAITGLIALNVLVFFVTRR
jgi:hypothetical protein